MRFRKFFITYEDGFVALFHWFAGACMALVIAAAIQSSTGNFFAALACLAVAVAIWTYGRNVDKARILELEEDLRTSGHPDKTALTKESAEKALNITRPRAT